VALAAALGACGSEGETLVDSDSVSSMVESSVDIDVDDSSVDIEVDDEMITDASEAVEDASERLGEARDALANGDFSTMLQALSLSGLADEIEDRDITILAPTDTAFGDMSADELRQLLTDPSSIDDVLRRHILVDAYSFDELKAQSTVESLAGDELTVTVDGGTIEVGGATVTEIEQLDENSSTSEREIQLYAIDRVLIDQ
jgi:uncharacterized surface protein with fasciclin (FAS1) repeats